MLAVTMLVIVVGPLGPERVSVVKKTLVLWPPPAPAVVEPITVVPLPEPETVVVGGRAPVAMDVAVAVELDVVSGPPGWVETAELLVKDGGEMSGVE